MARASQHHHPMPNGSLGLTEMFFQIRAENFGPLAAKVFRFVGDDGCRTGMSAFRLIMSA
jgi:hypothetical protein